MPDVTFYNYPYNQYVFTSSQLKNALLLKQGCDEWSKPLVVYANGKVSTGSAGCCNNGVSSYLYGGSSSPFVYQ